MSSPVTSEVAPKLDIKLELKSFDNETSALSSAEAILDDAKTTPNQTTIVSSENIQFLHQLGQTQTSNNGRSFLVFNDSLSRFGKKSVSYLKNSYQNDKIGFVIAVYTTAVETVMWIHVAPLSTLAISANVAFTIATALYFKINKDKWTQVTDRIKTPIKRFFNDVDSKSVRKNLVYDYLANLGLSAALNFVRIPLMSMNQILDEGLSLGLFKMPVLMSLAGTASQFTWSEHQGSINQKEFPIANFVFRRSAELRSVILVTFASSAALLNPLSFGIMPWVTLGIVGAGGLITYLKGPEINEWVEQSPIFRKLEGVVKLNSGVAGINRCQALFN